MIKIELDSLEGCGIGGNRIVSSRILQHQHNQPIVNNHYNPDDIILESEESEDDLVCTDESCSNEENETNVNSRRQV